MTILDIAKMKSGQKKISALTAYDFPFAKILDEAEMDIIMVGDSLGNVILGYENTLPVTMDEMIHHTKAVGRGIKKALLVGDMPFGSYHGSLSECVGNATRFVKEAGVKAVKLEGGRIMSEKIKALVQAGIPIMGHVGLTPQSVHKFGGFKIQGRGRKNADEVLKDAEAVEKAGAFSIVLEGIPHKLGKQITAKLSIPTIGIGAGPFCDGQILVLHDLLGLSGDFKPTFARCYANVGDVVLKAIKKYKKDIQMGRFPTIKESFENGS